MINSVVFKECAGNLRIDVMFDDCNIFECFMSVDEVIVRSASPIMLNIPKESAYWKDIIKQVEWCEDNFETMRNLYYGD